jgi:hypothetical protein
LVEIRSVSSNVKEVLGLLKKIPATPTMRRALLSIASGIALLLVLFTWTGAFEGLRAQKAAAAGASHSDEFRSGASDALRECPNRAQQPEVDSGDLIFDRTSWGNNPQEGQYREEMERLLRLEVDNVRTIIKDVENKHRELTRAKPSAAGRLYKELVLEDRPGVWRDGQYVNSRKILALHFRPEDRSIDCVVLDLYVQSIYVENQWTRKLLRLYNPHIQTVELQTIRHNYEQGGTLEKTDPEIQLKALRLIFADMRTAMYMLDLEIAAHYDYKNRIYQWQLGL